MSVLQGAVSGVAQGRHGRLFLGRQDGFDLGRFTDGTALPPNFLVQWRATLQRRAGELAERGIPYVFIIAPDAPSVHAEELPDPYPRTFRSPGRVFLDAVGDIPGVHFVYPVEALRSARGGLEVYQKTDSHWTTFGSYVAYRELMRVVCKLVHCDVVPERRTSYTFRRSYGDLGSQCDPEQQSEIPIVAFTDAEPERVWDGIGPERRSATATRMPGLPPCRALAFRDSFMTDLAPYLARSFSDLLMLGTTTRMFLDAVDEWKADIVISEVAERRLVAFQPDHDADRHDWLYLTEYSGELGRAMQRAVTIMRHAPGEAVDIVRGHDAECISHPAHAYAAGLIMEIAGALPEAIRFADAALGMQSGASSVLALRARLALGMLQPAEASGYAARAVACAPWNGSLHELHVYTLMQEGLPGRAGEVAEAALARIKDHANLWYWASVLRGAAGHSDGAREAIQMALSLAPDNADYHAQLAILSS